MCRMVYLASPVPLDLVPWNATAPGFHVTPLERMHEAVRKQFAYPNVYYAGGYEGCGCSFQYGEYWALEDPNDNDWPDKKASLAAFSHYLSGQLLRAPTIQVYAAWDGDQGSPVMHRRQLTPDSLLQEDFFFLERELSTFSLVDSSPQ